MFRKIKAVSGVVVAVFIVALILLLTGATDLLAQSNWQATYWNNRTLSGTPVLQRQEAEINYDWGGAAPAVGVNDDDFSVRWTRTINVPAGVYRFTATMDDGMRVWVDNVLIIDAWYDSQVHSISADYFLSSGDHNLRVEYYEAGGQAVARLSWTLVSGAGPGITAWRGEYFNNTALAGTPAAVRDDAEINFNWGGGSPAPGVAADYFSVRWTRNLSLDAGRYRFTTVTDDGVRLWVNNQLLIDRWQNQPATSYSGEIDLPGGSVPVRMEYYDHEGTAEARLSWTRLSGPVGPINNWRGEYFNNTGLSGSPALVRDDADINFNWGTGSPAPGIISDDGFSVRWTRTVNFTAGRYRFTLTSDDGARLWVNNQLLIDRWQDQMAQTFTADIDLPGGAIPIRMEYYERGGEAQARLSWAPVSSTPVTPPSTATATVNAFRLNVRQGPGVGFGIITTLTRGQAVTLLARNADATWVQATLPNGAQGWLSARYLTTTTDINNLPVAGGQPPATSEPVTSAHVTAGRLNVRSGPGVTYSIVTTVANGQVVTLAGYRNAAATWVQITLPNGTQGWVNVSYVSTTYPISNLAVWNG